MIVDSSRDWDHRGLGRALEEALRRGAKRVYAGTRRPLAHLMRRLILVPAFVLSICNIIFPYQPDQTVRNADQDGVPIRVRVLQRRRARGHRRVLRARRRCLAVPQRDRVPRVYSPNMVKSFQ